MMENKEILSKVLIKADELQCQRSERKRKLRCCCTIIGSLCIILCFAFAMPSVVMQIDTSLLENHNSVGTLFSDSSYIGYLTIGIISFILGFVVAIICYRSKNRNERKEHEHL